MTSKTRAYGRGILRFTCWEPCRLPGQVHNLIDLKQVETGRKNCAENGNHVNTTKTDTSQTSAGIAVPGTLKVPAQKGNKPVKLLAKYNYKGNPDRPGGFDELTVIQGEKLDFCKPHPKNPHWWEAKNDAGDVGFIPATYMMVLEDKISVLPWLEEQKKREEEIVDNKPAGKLGGPAFKPYKSAYEKDNNKSSSSESYYCDVCGKNLNGPIPYKMHLNSKAHKEEMALREEFNQ